MESSSLHAPSVHQAEPRPWIKGPRSLILVAAIPVVLALVLGWPWLVSAGIISLLLAIAPCALMCALGLCMKNMSDKGCSTASQSQQKR